MNLKKLFILLFSLLISFNSYGEWVFVSEGIEDGAKDKWFVDKDTIKKEDGFTYYWVLADYGKTIPPGIMSAKIFYEGDCSLYRDRGLKYIFYKKPMGKGESINFDNNSPSSEWQYRQPNSNMHIVMKYTCNAR